MTDPPPPKEHMLITLWGQEPTRAIEAIRHRHPNIEVTFFPVMDTDNFVDVVSVGNQVPDELWAKVTILVTLFALPRNEEVAPNLTLIHLFSAGIDHFSTHPILTTSTIPLTLSTGIAAPPIGEYILMVLLSLTNALPRQLTWQRSHHWGTKTPFLGSMGDWVGKTVGIAGYGSIGRHAGRLLVAMGARVYAYTARARRSAEERRDTKYVVPGTGDPEGKWPERWFSGEEGELRRFLGSGLHALVVCLPLTEETRGCIGREEFRVLQETSPFPPAEMFDKEGGKPAGAWVVNISRGAVIDQVALVDAVKNRVVRGVALDATDPEPLPEDSELWELDNVIVTPHTSALGSEYPVRGFGVLMENLERRRKGMEMWNLVKREKGY